MGGCPAGKRKRIAKTIADSLQVVCKPNVSLIIRARRGVPAPVYIR